MLCQCSSKSFIYVFEPSNVFVVYDSINFVAPLQLLQGRNERPEGHTPSSFIPIQNSSSLMDDLRNMFRVTENLPGEG